MHSITSSKIETFKNMTIIGHNDKEESAECIKSPMYAHNLCLSESYTEQFTIIAEKLYQDQISSKGQKSIELSIVFIFY